MNDGAGESLPRGRSLPERLTGIDAVAVARFVYFVLRLSKMIVTAGRECFHGRDRVRVETAQAVFLMICGGFLAVINALDAAMDAFAEEAAA